VQPHARQWPSGPCNRFWCMQPGVSHSVVISSFLHVEHLGYRRPSEAKGHSLQRNRGVSSSFETRPGDCGYESPPASSNPWATGFEPYSAIALHRILMRTSPFTRTARELIGFQGKVQFCGAE
jgi:hypothetical protein